MNQIIKYGTRLCFIILLLWTVPAWSQSTAPQTITIEGTVVNEAGNPMAGIEVSVQEKNVSEVSDAQGKFYMLVLPNDILVINEKGYYPIVQPVGGKTTHAFTLIEYRKGEEEFVDVLYGRQTRRGMTLASATIGTDVIEKNAASTLEQAMNGTLAGLYSIKNGGENIGKNNFDFYVRGKATTANAKPLVLVDGMEFNIEMMDFHEVETITVLKDASALAIYGMRGANGVILITTKKGSELKSYINLDIRAGFQQPEYVGKRLNAHQYTTLYNEALKNDGSALLFNPGVYEEAGRDRFLYPDEDYKKQFIGNASPFQHYNFSAGGGNNIARYFVTAGYQSQKGLFKDADNNPEYDRFNIRTNMDVNITRDLSVNVLLSAGIDKYVSPYLGSSTGREATNSIFNTLMTLPANAFPMFNRNGSLGGTSEYQTNPYGVLNRTGSREDETRVLNALVKAKYDLDVIVPGLAVDAFYGFENYNMQYVTVSHQYAVFQETGADSYTQFGIDNDKNTRAAGLMSDFYRHNSFGAAVSYAKSIGTRHELSARLQYHHTVETVPGDNPDYKYQGLAARLHYGFQKKYYAELTAAYQGSTNYKKGKRSGFFPALGLSWIASDEAFLTGVAAIDLLKVRASYGLTGNDQTGGRRFAYRQEFTSDGGYGFDGSTGSDGSREGVIGNANDTWEKGYKANIGVDLELWKHLSLTADYFYERRTDILVPYTNQIPDLIGIGLSAYNAGKIKNRGVDANLMYKKQYKNGGFFVGGNVLWAKNEIIDIKELPYQYAHQFRKGHSINTQFGYQTNGFYTTADQLTGAPGTTFGIPALGDLRYVNQNPDDDNVIDDRDRVALGNTFPELIYGLSLGGSYKGFDVQCYLEGSERFDTFFIPAKFSAYTFDNRWNPDAPTVQTAYPRLSVSSDYNRQTSDFWQEKAHLLRVNSVELGYTLPQSVTQRLRMSTIRIYMNANNPVSFFTIRDDRNPEAVNAGYSQYPLLRTISFGLSLKL